MTVPIATALDLGLLAAMLLCLFRGLRSARREARGRAMSIQRLCSTPTLASIAALVCLIGPVGHAHNVGLWLIAFVLGFGMGAARGTFVELQVDRDWNLIRTWQADDGFTAMKLLAAFGGLELVTIGIGPHAAPWRMILASGTAACAAFLVGRVAAVWFRAQSESHMELRPTAQSEVATFRMEERGLAWVGKTAGIAVPALPAFAGPDLLSASQDEETDASSQEPIPPAPVVLQRIAPIGQGRPTLRDARGRFVDAGHRAGDSGGMEPSEALEVRAAARGG